MLSGKVDFRFKLSVNICPKEWKKLHKHKNGIRLTVGCIIPLIKFSSASLVVDVPEQPIFWNYYTKHNFSV